MADFLFLSAQKCISARVFGKKFKMILFIKMFFLCFEGLFIHLNVLIT